MCASGVRYYAPDLPTQGAPLHMPGDIALPRDGGPWGIPAHTCPGSTAILDYIQVSQRSTVPQTLDPAACIRRPHRTNKSWPISRWHGLPKNRAFAHTGLDHFGHFEVRRRRTHVKCWGRFLLASPRKLCTLQLRTRLSLSTSPFIQCFIMFLCHHGYPTHTLFSDNGTNFRGADKELWDGIGRLDHTKIHTDLRHHSVN